MVLWGETIFQHALSRGCEITCHQGRPIRNAVARKGATWYRLWQLSLPKRLGCLFSILEPCHVVVALNSTRWDRHGFRIYCNKNPSHLVSLNSVSLCRSLIDGYTSNLAVYFRFTLLAWLNKPTAPPSTYSAVKLWLLGFVSLPYPIRIWYMTEFRLACSPRS